MCSCAAMRESIAVELDIVAGEGGRVVVVEDLEVAEEKCRSIWSALGIDVYGHIYGSLFYCVQRHNI